jgi:hypothetical protein
MYDMICYGSFPIKESVKKAIMDKYPHPEQAVYISSWKNSTTLTLLKFIRKPKRKRKGKHLEYWIGIWAPTVSDSSSSTRDEYKKASSS